MALPRDVGLGKDNFQKSMIFNETDSLANYILNILIMRPGNLPSMPKIGVNIAQYVHANMQGELDPEFIKGLITSNCAELLPYLSADDLIVAIMLDEYNREVLMIKIPLVMDNISKVQKDAYYAFYRNELNELEFSFLVDDNL